jgi:hypothetical protein
VIGFTKTGTTGVVGVVGVVGALDVVEPPPPPQAISTAVDTKKKEAFKRRMLMYSPKYLTMIVDCNKFTAFT